MEEIHKPQGSPEKQRKRRRISLACETCRARKSRCDGSRPKCSLCADLGFVCIYKPPHSATNIIVHKNYFESLESRVKKVEDILSTLTHDLKDRPKATSPLTLYPVLSLTGAENIPKPMGTVFYNGGENPGSFGPSSSVAFLRSLSRAVALQGHIQSGIFPANAQSFDAELVNSLQASPLSARPLEPNELFDLPPQDEMDDLVQKYFSQIGIMFPYLYPPAFLETYNNMVKTSSANIRRTWLGLLNLIFAMVKISLIPATLQADACIIESDVFYLRGLQLCGNEILHGSSLEVVQFLLLMCQYLQGTQKLIQAWTMHGLAVKAALQLGLYSANALVTLSPLEQEARKRTWFGCVVLDRSLSMTLGRPAMIPDHYVRLDLPALHALIDTSTVMDDNTTALSLIFFNSTLMLSKEVAEIIDQLYDHNLDCGAPLSISETVARTLTLDQNLSTWRKSVPPSLQLMTEKRLQSVQQEPISRVEFFSQKYSAILSLRFLHVRVFLHQPILTRFINACGNPEIDPGKVQLLEKTGLDILQSCMESAMEIIDIVYGLAHATNWQYNLLESWWFSLYYTFNAALVVLGGLFVYRMDRIVGAAMSELFKKARLYPRNAAAALLKLNGSNHAIARCQHYIVTFDEIVNRVVGTI